MEKQEKPWRAGIEWCETSWKNNYVATFCSANYKNVIYLNIAEESVKDCLACTDACKNLGHATTVLDFLVRYTDNYGLSFSNNRQSVIIIDEIQESQQVI